MAQHTTVAARQAGTHVRTAPGTLLHAPESHHSEKGQAHPDIGESCRDRQGAAGGMHFTVHARRCSLRRHPIQSRRGMCGSQPQGCPMTSPNNMPGLIAEPLSSSQMLCAKPGQPSIESSGESVCCGRKLPVPSPTNPIKPSLSQQPQRDGRGCDACALGCRAVQPAAHAVLRQRIAPAGVSICPGVLELIPRGSVHAIIPSHAAHPPTRGACGLGGLGRIADDGLAGHHQTAD